LGLRYQEHFRPPKEPQKVELLDPGHSIQTQLERKNLEIDADLDQRGFAQK
jgi:hypothetical protein